LYSSYVATKTPWHAGTTHLVMSPLEFMQRLAALVPRPRLHLIRFGVRITSLCEVSGPPLREHGVLAPDARMRAMVVPQGSLELANAAQPAECEPNCDLAPDDQQTMARAMRRHQRVAVEAQPVALAHGRQ